MKGKMMGRAGCHWLHALFLCLSTMVPCITDVQRKRGCAGKQAKGMGSGGMHCKGRHVATNQSWQGSKALFG